MGEQISVAVKLARMNNPAYLKDENERLEAENERLKDFEQTQCAKLLIRIGELERERDAAVEDLKRHSDCWDCDGRGCHLCDGEDAKICAGWQWRGVEGSEWG